jgi:hypothetical protein
MARKDNPAPAAPTTAPVCGIVMPISAIDGCPAEHWIDVRNILDEAIKKAGFKPELVSDADDVGVIHKRIVQNLYNCPVVVCDVSGKNPNVMFELGMRLTFDKATVIVKDDVTGYSFDTSVIEHVPYPRDLRFAKIVAFQERLVEKIKATDRKATEDKGYSPFLKNFGQFTVPKLETTAIPQDEYVLNAIRELETSVSQLVARMKREGPLTLSAGDMASRAEMRSLVAGIADDIIAEISPDFLMGVDNALQLVLDEVSKRLPPSARMFRSELRRTVRERLEEHVPRL